MPKNRNRLVARFDARYPFVSPPRKTCEGIVIWRGIEARRMEISHEPRLLTDRVYYDVSHDTRALPSAGGRRRMSEMPIAIRHAERPQVIFPGGAQYCPVIGDDNSAGVPLRTGIQTSPPGYETQPHSHPYVELLTVLDGEGEA